MKKLAYIFAALFMVLAICLISPLNAKAATSRDLVYTLNSDGKGYTVTDCNTGAIGVMEIPATFSGKPVTGIGEKAFYACVRLTEIIIPDSVTSIGVSAFEDCSDLTSITIPNGVTSISDSAFYGCSSLTSITIPDGVTSIGHQAFMDCSSLTTITIPDGVTSIGFSAFEGCKSLTGITIPEGVTWILSATFKNCYSLTNVQIPDSATYIGDYAFSGSGITEITIPDGVTKIEYNAFYNCGNLTRVIGGEAVTSIGKEAFKNCVSLASVAIGKNVTSVDQEAFRNCISLTGISIGNSATSIGNSAFYGCSKLSSITLGSSVTSIGNLAFKDCSSLTEIIIPDSVTSLGNRVFQGCRGLTRVTIGKGVTHIPDYTFENCSSLTSITISGSLTNIGWHAFSGCSSLPGITIPAGVKEIGTYAFYNCEALASITIPSSVTTIGSCAFHDCGLTDVYYGGTTSQWPLISGISYNEALENATVHCSNGTYVKPPEPTCPNGHQSDAGTVTKEATCTETGTKIYKCLQCKETIKTETLPALEHNYDKGTITKMPTCVEFGEARYTCQRCGETKTESMSKSKTHTYQAAVTKATLSKDGANEEKCTGCGKVKSSTVIACPTTFTLSTVNYTYNNVVKKPAVTVKDANGKTLVSGTDYTVTYPSGRVNPGSYTLTVTMKGNYSGTKKLTFNINLGTPSVTVSNATNGVKISWNAISGAKNYKVYKSVYSGGKWSSWTAIKTGYTGTSYTDTTVKSGHNVRYTVRAFNGSNSSTFKASNSIKFLAAPKVTASNAAGGVKLTWNAVGSAKTYTIYKSVYSGGKWGGWVKIKTGVTGTTYTDTTVKSGHNVKYTVRAVNGSFASYFTSSNSIKFLATPTVKVAKTTTGIKASWNAVGSAKGYIVYRRAVVNGKWSSWEVVKTTTALSFTDSTAKTGVYYQYTVRAYNGNFRSAYKNSSSIKR